MTPDAIMPPGTLISPRLFRIGYLPAYAATAFLLSLIWAGAPGRPVIFARAWRTADHVGVVGLVLLVLVITMITAVLQPLQASMVAVLEGGFPRWLGAGFARRSQLWRKRRLERSIQAKVDRAAALECDPASRAQYEALVGEAGVASAFLRSRFPAAEHLVRPTSLGNALAAIADDAGAAYGLDTVVAWPRLYPVLGDQVRAMVDDLRDSLDASARLTVTGMLTGAATIALLAGHSGWRTLLALIPFAVAALAYSGAIRAAVVYGTAIRIGFDLYRFDMLQALHLEVPRREGAEQAKNTALSDFFRQGVPASFTYTEPGRPDGNR
jgi:hypothetical protein